MVKRPNTSEKQSVFQQWADVTTAHGFYDFSKARSTLGKLIWSFLIGISLIIMSYQLYGFVTEYANHEWTTAIREKDPDGEYGIKFPSIFVCNQNRLKYSKVMEYNMTLAMVRFLFRNAFQDQYIIKNVSTGEETDEYVKWRLAHNFKYLEIYEKMGPSCNDIFVLENCEKNGHITAISTPEYGHCYRLDFPMDNVTSYATTPGSIGGKSFMLNIQGWDYLPLIENNYLVQGLAIQLSYSRTPELGNWINLQPGRHISLNMQLTEKTIRLPSKSSLLNPFQLLDALRTELPCASNPSLRYFKNDTYSTVNCAMECFWNRPIERWSCMPYLLHALYRTCEAEEVWKYMLNWTDAEWNKEVMMCVALCRKPCYDRYIEMTVTQASFPSDEQRPVLEKWLIDIKRENVQVKDIIILEIFFGSLTINLIETYEVMSLDNLVSSAGGLIGVWAGMSFLTVFQAVEYMLKFIEERIKKCTTVVVPKKEHQQTINLSCDIPNSSQSNESYT